MGTQRREHGSVRNRVREVLAAEPDRVFSSAEVAERIDLDLKPARVGIVLSALAERGEAIRVSAGRYRNATNAPRPESQRVPSEEAAEMQKVGTLEDTGAVLLRDGHGCLWMAERLTTD